MARCNMSIERCLGVIFMESTAEITFFFPVRGAGGIHYYLYHLHSTYAQGTSINQNNAHTA